MDEDWQKAWDEPQEIAPARKQALLDSLHRRMGFQRRQKRLYIIGIGAAAAVLLAIFIRTPSLFPRIDTDSWQELASTETPQKITLDDSSVLWLAPHSAIRLYPDLSKQRSAILTSGSAFIIVAKDERHSFSITVNHQKVTVLGTSFTIHKVDSVDLQLTVKEGKVALDNIAGRRLLTAGQQVSTDRGKTVAVQAGNSDAADWWLQPTTRWHNIPLEELLDRVENYYHVRLKYGEINRKMKVTLTWDITTPLKDNLAVLNTLTGYDIH
jgi:transmembrane sensor